MTEAANEYAAYRRRIARAPTVDEMIVQLWQDLRDAGLPEVMLYLADGTASRCHWDETALIGAERVALLADQERGIVRVIPIRACSGIGIASPKGIDPSGYRRAIHEKLATAKSKAS